MAVADRAKVEVDVCSRVAKEDAGVEAKSDIVVAAEQVWKSKVERNLDSALDLEL